jgi:hypothetical protein
MERSREPGRWAFWCATAALVFTLVGPCSVSYDSFTTPFPVMEFFLPYAALAAFCGLGIIRAFRAGRIARPALTLLALGACLAMATDGWYLHQLQPNGKVKVSPVRWW